MPSRIVFHVGPHKTGSTALQEALVRSRAQLAQHGVVYPGTGISGAGHHGMVDWARRWGPAPVDPAEIAAEADGKTLVVSTENAVLLPPPLLETLREALGGAPVRVVYYLRRLVDLWPSHWQEMVKHGATMSFGTYLAYASGLPKAMPSRRMIHQGLQLAALERAFGHEAVTVVGYDRLRAEGTDIFAHFAASILGVEGVDADAPASSNRSNPFWKTELLRAFNIVHHDRTGGHATLALRDAVERALAADGAPLVETFRDLAEARAGSIVLDGTAPAVARLQEAVVRRFSDRFEGDREAVERAYMAPGTRTVRTFDVPIAGADRLRADLVAFYDALPEAARRSHANLRPNDGAPPASAPSPTPAGRPAAAANALEAT